MVSRLGFISDKHSGSPHSFACPTPPGTDTASPWIQFWPHVRGFAKATLTTTTPWRSWDSRGSRRPNIYAVGENLEYGGSWSGLGLMSYYL
ncbi:hypothetical protein ASPBRDRAFT_123312 [Aspergillus brasiliensis CBS 101740]|uniref:Uncharacterized protein n=1 Tax=Aspergillus brasiliensis (strain CBS 101740 / IMI 381727 / IBT 21946) TaxID=767769 RepID=A0A1L9UMY2_ASPBC|nr:hypothetical protein ASPBRDRAFT_123312 [Aspergillus brasiliensis CBS 101740]